MEKSILCESFPKQNNIRIIANILNGDSIELYVRSTDCIKDIKDRIENLSMISSYDQLISYRGSTLQDQQIIDECGILNNSTINIINRLRGGMQIFAKTLDGKTVSMEVFQKETVAQIKIKIQEKLGMSPEEQSLIYQGKILEDDQTVNQCQITDKSVINIVVRLKGGMRKNKNIYKLFLW